MRRRGRRDAFALGLADSLCGMKQAFSRGQRRLNAAFDTLLSAWIRGTLTDAQIEALTVRRYSRHAYGLAKSRSETPLAPWEQDWFARDLPAAPARLLVLAAGAGRELVALQAQGYTVDACEPASASFAHLAARIGPPGVALQEDFRAFVARVRSGGCASYDAVIIGWGGLSCTAGAVNRIALLDAAAQVSRGPVLLSFLKRAPDGRSAQIAQQVAQRLHRALGRPVSTDEAALDHSAGYALAPAGHGMLYAFSEAEFQTLLKRAALELQPPCDPFSQPGYPHATLRRVHSSA